MSILSILQADFKTSFLALVILIDARIVELWQQKWRRLQFWQ